MKRFQAEKTLKLNNTSFEVSSCVVVGGGAI